MAARPALDVVLTGRCSPGLSTRGCSLETVLIGGRRSGPLVAPHPTHGLADGRCRLLGVLVLPHSYRAPPCAPEEVIRLGVPLSVPADFFRPVLRIGGRPSRMVGTPVPEAPVNEDCHTGGTEHEVGGASEITQRTRSHPVPKTESVHGVANCQLWPSVPAPVRKHRGPSGR